MYSTLWSFRRWPSTFAAIAIYWINFAKDRRPVWFEESELCLLPVREQNVLRLRSPMDDGIEHSNVEIGWLLGVNNSRVMSIINSALTKIRHQREREREETKAVARSLPPLPGKAKISAADARDWLDRGVDQPWVFPEEIGRSGPAPVSFRTPPEEDEDQRWRPPPITELPRGPLGPAGRPIRRTMFGFWHLPKGGIYLYRYGYVVPASNYSSGRVECDGKTSVLPAFRHLDLS